jgi:hypothetical protein
LIGSITLVSACRRETRAAPTAVPTPPGTGTAPSPATPPPPPSARGPAYTIRANADHRTNTLYADGRGIATYNLTSSWTASEGVTIEAVGDTTVAIRFVDSRGTPWRLNAISVFHWTANGVEIPMAPTTGTPTPAPTAAAVGLTPEGDAMVTLDGRTLARLHVTTDWNAPAGVTLEGGPNFETVRYADPSGGAASVRLSDTVTLTLSGG